MLEVSVIENEVAALIIETLNLQDVAMRDIVPEAPLFREGLGLDSIDALELDLAISQRFGIKINSSETDVTQIFSSLRALSKYIELNRVD